jgi:hypothetical protein
MKLERVHQSDAMLEGIKLLRNNGMKNWCCQINHEGPVYDGFFWEW